jgi:hypothetical protein
MPNSRITFDHDTYTEDSTIESAISEAFQQFRDEHGSDWSIESVRADAKDTVGHEVSIRASK